MLTRAGKVEPGGWCSEYPWSVGFLHMRYLKNEVDKMRIFINILQWGKQCKNSQEE